MNVTEQRTYNHYNWETQSGLIRRNSTGRVTHMVVHSTNREGNIHRRALVCSSEAQVNEQGDAADQNCELRQPSTGSVRSPDVHIRSGQISNRLMH